MTTPRLARPFPVVFAVGILVLAGCGSGAAPTSSPATATPAPGTCAGQRVTLTIGTYGDFGYAAAGLYDAYMRSHPCVAIVASTPDEEPFYWSVLQTNLATGIGVDDIQAIDVGRMAYVTANQADQWVDLTSLPGARSVTADFASWSLALATTYDRKLLALGADIGPLAMCYQPKLLQAAGLPASEAGLEALMPSWAAYVALGKQYRDALPSGTAWTDSGASLFAAAMGSAGEKYTDSMGKVIYDTNPIVRGSWNLAVDAIQSGLTTTLAPYSASWNDSLARAAFATMPCPSWMLPYIKSQAGTAGSGVWSVMKSPGAGHSHGSYLAIPVASQHRPEAWDLLEFLTSADSQASVFRANGSFPANTRGGQELKDYKDAYFNQSPIGALYSASAAAVPIQAIGLYDDDIETAIENGLLKIAQKGSDPDTVWDEVVRNINAVVGQ